MSANRHGSFNVTEFLQSLQTQLDHAQDALALRTAMGRPLTWALKDMSIDLRAFAEVEPTGRMRLRSAGPGEEGSSTFKFSFTTITRPMVEENTLDMKLDEDPRSLNEIESAGLLDADSRRRLERVGVRTVGELKRLDRAVGSRAIQAVAGTPMDSLRAALVAASRPVVSGHAIAQGTDGDAVLRIQGANLTDGLNPEVRLEGEAVEVLSATPQELVVRPRSHHGEGQIEVMVGQQRATGYFRLRDNDDRQAAETQAEAREEP